MQDYKEPKIYYKVKLNNMIGLSSRLGDQWIDLHTKCVPIIASYSKEGYMEEFVTGKKMVFSTDGLVPCLSYSYYEEISPKELFSIVKSYKELKEELITYYICQINEFEKNSIKNYSNYMGVIEEMKDFKKKCIELVKKVEENGK